MGKDYELVRNTGTDEDNMENIYMKIVDEKQPVIGKDISKCDCDNNCDDCEEKPMNSTEISEGEAVLRNRFKGDDTPDALKTSAYDVDKGGWVERDPETTQIFRRKEQATGLFSLSWSGSSGPDIISREEAWKLYIRKLQDESNYLLNSPDNTEICCCEDCIAEYELQCNEVLGWRKRAPTVEGFTKEVNALCDPSAVSVLHTLVQDKYRSMPCSIM